MNQRFKEIADELKKSRKVYSDADLARILGISRSEMSNVIAERRPVSKRIVNNLLSAFPDINEEWLRTGEGNMLKDNDSSSDYSPAIAEDHSTAVSGYQNVVNSDPIIVRLLDEISAQRRLTENAQEALLNAQKQISDLITKLR